MTLELDYPPLSDLPRNTTEWSESVQGVGHAEHRTLESARILFLGPEAETVDLPALTYVERLIISQAGLRSCELPALTKVETLWCIKNPVLESIALPNLLEASALRITRCESLESLEMPLVTRTDGLTITDNPRLEKLYLQRLMAETVTVENNPKLRDIRLRKFSLRGSSLFLQYLEDGYPVDDL